MAPATYAGRCSGLLDGAHALSEEAKKKLEADCGVSYPCREDLLSSSPNEPLPSSSARPQLLSWSWQNGAVPSPAR